MVSKSVLKIIAVWLSFNLCTAEEPTFSYPTGNDDEFIDNQYIVEFRRNNRGEESKLALFNAGNRNDDDSPRVIRRIDSRNISVVKFRSRNAAEKWRASVKGIKYFERGKNTNHHHFNHTYLLLVLVCKIELNSPTSNQMLLILDPKVYLQDFSPSKPGKTRNLAESVPYGIDDINIGGVVDSNSSLRKVCVIDSGYDINHEDLPHDSSIVTGTSLVPGDNAWYVDEITHGTHVTGTIAAIAGNGIGVRGIIGNGQLRLHIVKVFGPSYGPSASVTIAAIEDCVAEGANVINMSLGGSGRSDAYQDAVTAAYEKGVLIFAAAGNTASSGYFYPASYDHVTSVGAVDSYHRHSSFSTYNDMVDICAPGSRVLSTVPSNGYSTYSGTSMACPHAAGVAALVWSNFPTLPAEQLRTILESTATDLPLEAPNGRDDKYGHGLINAKAAYDAISSVPTDSPTPAPTVACSSIAKRSMCLDTTGCSWDVDEEGIGFCQSGLSCVVSKRSPCLERNGCFWKSDDLGGGRCKRCSSLLKRNNCNMTNGCKWNDVYSTCGGS